MPAASLQDVGNGRFLFFSHLKHRKSDVCVHAPARVCEKARTRAPEGEREREREGERERERERNIYMHAHGPIYYPYP